MMAALQRHFYVAQRATALVLAPLVVIHLVLIMIAVKNGLTADEILSRTRGNVLWAAFYSLFVVAAAIHAPLGVRNVLREWTPLSSRGVDVLCLLLFVFLLFAGLRAVVAVY
jgi:fumarate reductase subunit C